MTEEVNTQRIRSFTHAELRRVPNEPVLIVRAISEFIPLNHFQSIFVAVGEIVKRDGITKLIFDKRSLRVFDPESMEWYFTQWKEEMYEHGLRTHYKIMPGDVPFKYSVDTARQRIFEEHPNARFHRMDIQYVGSVEEALAR